MLDTPAGYSIELAAKRIISRRYKGTRNVVRAERVAAGIAEFFTKRGQHTLESITADDIADYAEWREEEHGNTASTVNNYLSVISSMFDEFKKDLRDPLDPRRTFNPPEIPWRAKRRRAKWWLTPEMEPKVLQWCIEHREIEMADLISFITHTGCRVEETFRLQRDHFDFTTNMLTIPGTKTHNSQRTVPMMAEAAEIAKHRLRHAGHNGRLFRFTPSTTNDEEHYLYLSYAVLNKKWGKLKVAFNWKADTTATPKALRRTFARRANDRGMPTEMLRDYMGHADIQTTVEYLRLVGGHNKQAMASYLMG